MNDPLDQKLSVHYQTQKKTPLADHGFSARVLTALPAPRPASVLLRWFAWDNQLAVALIVIAVLLCIPFGGHASGLDILNTSLDQVSNWFSLSPLALALGATIATLILLGEDDELLPSWI